MKIKAQVSMVMNFDKCIGCHTCSITCKNAWTNRPGAEYMYFNNVETKPGIGYPKRWEDQEKWKGGWHIDKDGKLALRSGSKGLRMLKLFYHPEQPELDDYYEPWTYDYETLIHSKRKNNQPVARPRSLITQKRMDITWGPNWEDDLAGGETARNDVNLEKLSKKITLDFEDIFMKYLPRNCNHCLNPACVAACPSGAIYKRDEDGIVLVSQDVCRGWRHCVPSCPYKKVYYNWETNKAEKCTFCYPRIENGLSMICADTCVGRLRYTGVLLYDADRIHEVASSKEEDIYEHMLSLLLDPEDPEVLRQAREEGIPEAWLKAAQESPIYKIVKRWKIGLPLHPEYRTLPMVWYVPPMSPIMQNRSAYVYLPDTDEMRIPLEYIASIFSAGNTKVIADVLQRMLDMRLLKKAQTVGEDYVIKSDLDEVQIEAMYRLLAIAKVKDRFVLPVDPALSHEEKKMKQGQGGFSNCSGCGSSGGCSSGASACERGDRP